MHTKMANSNNRKHCQQNHACFESKKEHCQNMFEKFIEKLFFKNLQSRKTRKCHKIPCSAGKKVMNICRVKVS